MSTNTIDSPWLDTEGLARYLGVPMKTVQAWRYRGVGPPGYRRGKHVLYDAREVDAWVRADAAGIEREAARA
jgi:hypothetical protein